MIREELQQQQRDFRRRQELFKIEQLNFLKEQHERNQIQDQIDRNRRDEKLRKLQEVKALRLEQSKQRVEFYKN